MNFSLRRSTDCGQSWSDISYILPSNYYQLQKHAFSISDSIIYFIYSHWDEGIIFEFMKSSDWGESWTESSEIFRTQQTGPIDMATRGDTIHFVWGGRFNDNQKRETYYIKSEDGGVSWTDNILLSVADNHSSFWSVIVINHPGKIAVMWMDYKYTPYLWTGDLFIRYSYDSGDNWTEEEQLTFTHTAVSPRIVWQGDSIHVTWRDERYTQLDIFYMLSADNGATWGEEQRVDDDPERSQTPDIGISGENRFIVWGDHRLWWPGPGVYFSRWEPEVSVAENENIPLIFDQPLRAYPNPFNSATTIEYRLPVSSDVKLIIYNLMGQKVETLIDGYIETGYHSIRWDASGMASGIYFYRLTANDKVISKRMILLK